MSFLAENWDLILLVILIADKIVAATPTKYDDLILTAIKSVIHKTNPKESKGSGLPQDKP